MPSCRNPFVSQVNSFTTPRQQNRDTPRHRRNPFVSQVNSFSKICGLDIRLTCTSQSLRKSGQFLRQGDGGYGWILRSQSLRKSGQFLRAARRGRGSRCRRNPFVSQVNSFNMYPDWFRCPECGSQSLRKSGQFLREAYV